MCIIVRSYAQIPCHLIITVANTFNNIVFCQTIYAPRRLIIYYQRTVKFLLKTMKNAGGLSKRSRRRWTHTRLIDVPKHANIHFCDELRVPSPSRRSMRPSCEIFVNDMRTMKDDRLETRRLFELSFVTMLNQTSSSFLNWNGKRDWRAPARFNVVFVDYGAHRNKCHFLENRIRKRIRTLRRGYSCSKRAYRNATCPKSIRPNSRGLKIFKILNFLMHTPQNS